MSEPLQLPPGSYALADVHASCRRLVNCFSQAAPATPQLGQNPSDSKQKAPPIVLRRAAGITTYANSGLTGTFNAVRGMRLMQGVLYAVIGNSLYSVGQDATLTNLGTGITGTGFVRMTDNTACLTILVPGTANAYTYTTAGGALAAIAAAGFTSLGALDLSYIDSYTLFLQQNGQGFFNDDGKASSGTGPITFNTPSQFLREFGTDLFVGMSIDHRQITMFGTDTAETYVDAGNAVGSPFSSAPDGFIERGCHLLGGYTIAVQDEAPHWLASDLTVRRKNGETPMRVSNHGIEAILGAANLRGSYALKFAYEGHLFYAITMPNEQRTVCLDVTTGEWFELSSSATGYWRPLCIAQAYGKTFVGDSQGGKIGYLDTTATTEFGDVQPMSWTHQPVYSSNARISHRRLELMLGAGEAATYGTTPLVSMYVSDNNGKTFRAMATRGLGVKGKFSNRCVWTNLGTSRQRVYKFTVSDALLQTWTPDVQLDAAPGRF